MSDFNDLISVMPIDTLNKTIIDDNRVILPSALDMGELYDKCKDTINQTPLSPEKALYVFLKSQSQ